MATLRAEFIYPVNQLLVEREVLGGSATVEQDGFEIEVCIPVKESDDLPKPTPPAFEIFSEDPELPLAPGARELHGRIQTHGSSIAGVDRVLVRVSWQEEPGSGLTVQGALQKGSAVADRAMTSLVALIRSGRQSGMARHVRRTPQGRVFSPTEPRRGRPSTKP